MNNLDYIENYINENNLSGKIDLVGAHCQNKCESGPHIFVDDKMYNEVNENKIKAILQELS